MKFMLQSSLVAQLLCLGAVAQWAEPPPSTADPGTITDCTWWFVAGASDTCQRVTATYGITQAQLVAYNPILSTSCTFVTGNSYCIEQNWGAEPAPPPAPPSTAAPGVPTTLTTTTKAATTTTTTTPGNGVTTPTPIQPGMVSNCNKFYFVASGVTCGKVLADENISLADFAKWNPNVGAECTGMWAEVNVCVGVIGGSVTPPSTTTTTTTTTKPPVTTTAPGNGVTTPQPTQPGMVSNCNKFHWVAQGVTCSQILSYNGISLADFAKWNTGVGATCSGMWAEVNVCVGVIGGAAPPPPPPTTTTKPPVTTTAPGNGITTPQPTQPGMVTNCKKFHYVSEGNTCGQIISYNGITLANFVKWNTGVGATCQSMWAKTYVCVGV